MTEQQLDTVIRADRDLITTLVREGVNVLDLGCGDGKLLVDLIEKKHVKGRGIDIDESNLIQCVEQGLSVCQGDLDEGLSDYPDNSYDIVILNQTLQVIKKPEKVIMEMLRVGKSGIVGVPNFAYWKYRMHLLLKGQMPMSDELPFTWYNTPNIHLLTIDDFRNFCNEKNITIIQETYNIHGKWRQSGLLSSFPNLFAANGMFVIKGNNP